MKRFYVKSVGLIRYKIDFFSTVNQFSSKFLNCLSTFVIYCLYHSDLHIVYNIQTYTLFISLRLTYIVYIIQTNCLYDLDLQIVYIVQTYTFMLVNIMSDVNLKK